MGTWLAVRWMAGLSVLAAIWPARGGAQTLADFRQIPPVELSATASGFTANPDRAIDDDPATSWQLNADLPQWIQVDTGRSRWLGAIAVANANRRINGYTVYVANEPDPADWGDPVAAGNLGNNENLTTVIFNRLAAGRYIRFVVTSVYYSNYMSLKLFRVYEPRFNMAGRTGSKAFCNAAVVDIACFPTVDGGYDEYRVSASAEPPVSGWLTHDPENPPPALDLADHIDPLIENRYTLRAWFRDTSETLPTIAIPGYIVYTPEPPVTAARDTLTVNSYDGATYRVGPADIDDGSRGGTIDLDGTSYYLGLHYLGVSTGAVPPAVRLALEPGVHTVVLTVTNDAGNAHTDTCTVTVTDTVYDPIDADRTWTGGAGALNPEWFRGQNWSGGQPPVRSSNRTLSLTAAGTSRPDADYTVGRIAFSGGVMHAIDLDGTTLTIGANGITSTTTGTLGGFTGPSGNPGIVRISPSGARGNIDVGGNVRIRDGVTLGGKIGTIKVYVWNSDRYLDLRGAVMEGGLLDVDRIELAEEYHYIYLNNTTAIDTLRINTELSVTGRRGTRWIGNPADTVRYRLPENLTIVVGSDANPAIMDLGVVNNGYGNGVVHFNASTGGSFTGRLSRLRVAHATYDHGTRFLTGYMDMQGMDDCDIVTASFSIGTIGNDDHATPVRGDVRLPPGSVRTGTLIVGRGAKHRDADHWADLLLRGTYVVVTNSATIHPTGIVTVELQGASAGIDVEDGAEFSIHEYQGETGRLHVEFKEPPVAGETIYWGLRMAGDHAATLFAMSGRGELTYAFDEGNPAFSGMHAGVLYTNDFTYFALADEALFNFDPVAIARDPVFEVEPGGTVRVHVSEIDNGSADPLGRPFALTLNQGAVTGLTEVALTDLGPHAVTLVIAVDDNGTPLTDTAEATVTLLAVADGTASALIWNAGASTMLMDRREWFWSGNWNLDQPPLDPSAVNLTFRSSDVSIAVPLTGDERKAGVITFDGSNPGHTNVVPAGKTLVLDGVAFSTVSGGSPRGVFTGGGTLRIGTTGARGNISMPSGTAAWLFIRDGMTLGGKIGEIGMKGFNDNKGIDLRGAVIEDGHLDVDRIVMEEYDLFYIDNTTLIDTLRINQELTFGLRRPRWFGDPADAPLYRLPTNLVIIVGCEEEPAIMDLGIPTSTGTGAGGVNFNAATGGSFTGRLSRLRVAHATYSGSGVTSASMQMQGMDACDIVVGSIGIGTISDPAHVTPVRGTVGLPPGRVLTGTLNVGRDGKARDTDNRGDLMLYGTRLAVTNAATIRQSGIVTVNVGATASGLDLTADASFAIDGVLQINFTAPRAAKADTHYGLRWGGDHVQAIQDWVGDGSIMVDTSGLDASYEIFMYQGATYLGVPLTPRGTLILLR